MIPKLKFEYKITIAYLLIGGAWIIFSDKLLDYIVYSKQALTNLQTYKGWFYVVITAILLFFFLKKHLVKLRSAQKKAEESDQLKTAFLHNISHEIRTPMNSIIGFSELLHNPDLTNEKRQYYAGIIAQSGNSLLSIISDIVDIATIQANQTKVNEDEFNLNNMLKHIYEQFIVKAQIQGVSFSYNNFMLDEESFIKTDSVKLLAILTNLVGNAMKFTQKGYVNFGYTCKGDLLEFYVEDNGIGIPSGMHEEIFKRFRQLEYSNDNQPSGSGLGLAISKAYVEMLGGMIWLNSLPGKGSVFYFTIPFKKVNLADKSVRSKQQDIKIEIKGLATIVIAEDDDLNFMLLKEMLSDSRLTILRASNGLEALEICSSNLQVDLVLMDIKMPTMNGYEATEKIKKIRQSLPIIAQTAYFSEAEKSKAIACGCSDFINKPIDKDLLILKVNRLLNS